MNENSSETDHDQTIQRVAENEAEIRRKFARQRALKNLMEQGKLLLSMVTDYFRGHYREIPYWAIGASALALLYVLNPLDVIPDVVPGLGYLDDATVVAFCLKLIEKELQRYKVWKDAQKSSPIIDVTV